MKHVVQSLISRMHRGPASRAGASSSRHVSETPMVELALQELHLVVGGGGGGTDPGPHGTWSSSKGQGA